MMLIVLGKIVALLGRFLVGGTLFVAGTGKIRNGQSKFLQSILGYDLIPPKLAAFMANWLPYIEVMIGVMLIAGLFSQVVSVIAFSIFLMFTAALTLSLLRGKDNDCGCFKNVTPVKWRLVYRDIFSMGILLPVFAFKGGYLAVDTYIPFQTSLIVPVGASGLVVMVCVWIAVTLIVFLAHRLIHKNSVPVKAN